MLAVSDFYEAQLTREPQVGHLCYITRNFLHCMKHLKIIGFAIDRPIINYTLRIIEFTDLFNINIPNYQDSNQNFDQYTTVCAYHFRWCKTRVQFD